MPDLNQMVEQYRRDRLAKGVSKSAVRSEQSCLKQFMAQTGNIGTTYLHPRHVDKLFQANPNWAPSTFNLKRQQLGSFFKWLQTRGHLPRDADPLEGVRKRRRPRKEWVLIPQDRFADVLEAATSPRNRAIVAIGLYLFTRVSETQAIRWRDVDFARKSVGIYRTKTEEFDVLPLCVELEEELTRWKWEYGRQAGQVVRPEWYVIPAYTPPAFGGSKGESGLVLQEEPRLIPGSKLTTLTPQIKLVLAAAGHDGHKEGGHTLRRSGATALYHELSSRGHDRAIRTVQAMLGHANISTTEIYLSLDLDRKARNDLLSGRRMFEYAEAQVFEMKGRDGQEDAGAI